MELLGNPVGTCSLGAWFHIVDTTPQDSHDRVTECESRLVGTGN